MMHTRFRGLLLAALAAGTLLAAPLSVGETAQAMHSHSKPPSSKSSKSSKPSARPLVGVSADVARERAQRWAQDNGFQRRSLGDLAAAHREHPDQYVRYDFRAFLPNKATGGTYDEVAFKLVGRGGQLFLEYSGHSSLLQVSEHGSVHNPGRLGLLAIPAKQVLHPHVKAGEAYYDARETQPDATPAD
jgi:hypothetical protein